MERHIEVASFSVVNLCHNLTELLVTIGDKKCDAIGCSLTYL